MKPTQLYNYLSFYISGNFLFILVIDSERFGALFFIDYDGEIKGALRFTKKKIETCQVFRQAASVNKIGRMGVMKWAGNQEKN